MGTNRIYAEDELDCYFAQIIGARDALLMLIKEKLNLKLSEKDVELGSINSELKKKEKKQKIMKRLNKLSSDTTSWYWILNELRNKSIPRSILRKQAAPSISANINDNTNSSSVKNYFFFVATRLSKING